MAHEPVADAEGLRRVLESIPEFVLMVDRDGLIRYINRLEPGFSRDEVIGMHSESVLLPGSKRAFREAFASVLSGGETAEYEAEESIEAYVARKEDAKVSHGLCEDCFKREMEGLADSDEADERPA